MKTRVGFDWRRRGRMVTVPIVIATMMAAWFAPVSAQDGESGVDDNTYLGPNFGWSVEWDEDVWELAEEDNANGADFITLTTTDTDDAPFAYVRLYGVDGLFADPEECAEGWEEQVAAREGNSDVEPTDKYDLPDQPTDGAGAAYTFTFENEDGDSFDDVEYVQCQFLEEDGPLLIVWLFSTTDDFEEAVPYFEDLIDTVVLPDESSADDDEETQDEDATDDGESTDAEDPEETDEDATDEDATDDIDEDAADEDATDEDATDSEESDETDGSADSGIDGSTYTSPTYGFTVEWDDDLWVADPDAELIDNGDDGLDRLYVVHVEDDASFSDFYVEGRSAYDGDPGDCVEGEADALSGDPALIDLEPYEDEDGEPVAGESDAGGEYGAFLGTYEDEDGEEYELVWYIECQTLEEEESVVIFTLLTIESNYEDELVLAQEIIDSLDI